MGLFGQSSPFDADVEKATSDTNTTENWSLILDVCDKVSSNPSNAKDCLKAILKRMGHSDPHVVMQAIVLLDACINNCGKPFHLEIASREFENEFRRLLSKAQTPVSVKMRAVLKSWAENDFRSDPELNLIHALYIRLRQEGYDFSNLGDKPAKSAKTSLPKDPNVVTSQEEEDAIAKAIELSLKETKSSPRNQVSSSGGGISATNSNNSSSAYPSLYPSFSNNGAAGGGSSNASPAMSANASAPQAQAAEPRKVRALYDFEAAEENELTFFTGEILHVTDDSDQNWWKGFNQRGEGLFPSNFVTADLSVDPKRLEINQHQTKNAQFNNEIDELQQKTDAAIAAAADANQRIEIDESKIDRLLHLLHEANPEDPSQDSDEMLRLEQEVHQMGPLIDAELERVDRKHAQLTQLSSDLVDAINLYHSLMRDDRTALLGGSGTAGGFGAPYLSGAMQMPPGAGLNGPASLAYQQGTPMTNPQMLYGAAAGYPAGNTAMAGTFPLQMPPHTQNYGISSLPYAAAKMPPVASGMPPSTTAPPATHNSPINASVNAGAVTSGYHPTAAAPQQIPMQFQNGHMHAGQQLNGVSGQHQMNSTLVTATMQQQHPQQLPPQTNPANYSMLQQQPQQQQYAPTTTAHNTNIQQQQPIMLANQSTQILQQQQQTQPQQFMSPQHNSQQQQHMPYCMPQQYAAVPTLPNGHQQNTQFANMPMGGMPTTTTAGPETAGFLQQQQQLQSNQSLTQQSTVQQLNNQTSHHMDQFSQMQQQMAAMSLQMGGVAGGVGGVGMGQSFLNQNEAKQNIPIYQQQR